MAKDRKGFTKDFLKLMGGVEANRKCCFPKEEGITIVQGLDKIYIEDSNSIIFSGDGTQANPLTGDTQISPDAGNILVENANGLFVPGINVSTDTQSKFILTEPTNDIIRVDGSKIRDANNDSQTLLFEMKPGNLTNDFDDMTKAGAMTTATVAIVNGFDQVIVTGSTNASYIRFNRQISLGKAIIRLKVRVDAIGATAPLVGFLGIHTGAPYSSFVNSMYGSHINLLTHVVTESNRGTQTTFDGWGSAAGVGDVIEIEYRVDHLKGSLFTAWKTNSLTGEISMARRVGNSTAANAFSNHQNPAIVLADGTYSILEYKIISEEYRPKFLMCGDSMGASNRVLYSDSLQGKLESSLPYKAGCIATGSCKLEGMLAAQLWHAKLIKPEFLVIFHYLNTCQSGEANPANGNYATWVANFARFIASVKGMGITPIIVYPQTWAVIDPTGTNCAFYETHLLTNFASEILIKILTVDSHYDATGFHYNGVTNGLIKDAIIANATVAATL